MLFMSTPFLTGALRLLTGTLQVGDMPFTQCSCGSLQVLQVQTPKGGGPPSSSFSLAAPTRPSKPWRSRSFPAKAGPRSTAYVRLCLPMCAKNLPETWNCIPLCTAYYGLLRPKNVNVLALAPTCINSHQLAEKKYAREGGSLHYARQPSSRLVKVRQPSSTSLIPKGIPITQPKVGVFAYPGFQIERHIYPEGVSSNL